MLPFRKASKSSPVPSAAGDLRLAVVHCLDLLTRFAGATDIPLEAKVRLRRLKMAASSARGAIELEAVGVDICGLNLPTPAPLEDGPSVDCVVAGAAHAAEEVAAAAAVPGLSTELRRLAAMPAPSPLPAALVEFGAEMHKLRDVVRFLRERGDILSSTATGMAEYLGGLSSTGKTALDRLQTNKVSIADASSVEDLQGLRTELLSNVEGLIAETKARIDQGECAKDLVQMHEAHKTLLEAALVNAKEMAHGDALTGLGNERALNTMVRSGAVEGGSVGVIALSLDGLEEMREREGRDATGAVVQQFARVLKGELYENAEAFRIEGDTFVLMLPNREIAVAAKQAKELQARFAASPLRAQGRDVQLKLSLGVSAWKAGKAFREVFAKADKLRLMVKKSGGNGVKAKTT